MTIRGRLMKVDVISYVRGQHGWRDANARIFLWGWAVGMNYFKVVVFDCTHAHYFHVIVRTFLQCDKPVGKQGFFHGGGGRAVGMNNFKLVVVFDYGGEQHIRST